MGHIVKTPAGTWRANWRDPSGKQKAKTFPMKKAAGAFLAEIEGSKNRGAYVDPDAGQVRFETFAARWLLGRQVEARTAERTQSLLRAHLLPRWGRLQLVQIDFMSVQEWVVELGKVLAPPTVAKCYAGAGLRWGECAGLMWGAIDLDARILRVVQVAEETPRGVTLRPYPKTKAGVRTAPLPGFLRNVLAAQRERWSPGPAPTGLAFPTRYGTPMLRGNFRREVWVPALARAGLAPTFRFHDLRHSYATRLVTDGCRSTSCSGSWGTRTPPRPSTGTRTPRLTTRTSSGLRSTIMLTIR